jgi:hypothetical protein
MTRTSGTLLWILPLAARPISMVALRGGCASHPGHGDGRQSPEQDGRARWRRRGC